MINNIIQHLGAFKWITGAINFDEDLHFSSFYLRASSKLYGQNPNHTYSTIIAFYDNFREIYYIPYEECANVSNTLIDQACKNPNWLEDIIEAILGRSKSLEHIFDAWPSNSFENLSLEKLVSLYIEHNGAQESLYSVARIPESLDRGLGLFTKYLRTELSQYLSPEHSETELNSVFLQLTSPRQNSIAVEAEIAWKKLVQLIKADVSRVISPTSVGRLITSLNSEAISAIDEYRLKWGFLEYHGYGSRRIPTVSEYCQRILLDIQRETQEHIFGNAYELLNDKLPSKIGNSKLSKLLELYPHIGLAKLYRRKSQLKAFYYLDMLIAEIARRLSTTESIIRSMLPDEVIESIRQNHITERFQQRTGLIAYLISSDFEAIVTGDDAHNLQELIKTNIMPVTAPLGHKLHGIPVSLGRAHGTARKICRVEEAINNFYDGDILISEATDPDLLPIIRKAGAVVTQQGGVTAHASIVCRELGKPALIGVQDLLQLVGDGSQVIVNADEGYIEIISDANEFGVLDIKQVQQQHGAKAYNLKILQSIGLPVPPFLVLPWPKLRESLLLISTTDDSFHRLVDYIYQKLNAFYFAIRSSSISEDQRNLSQAGLFPSLLGIKREDLIQGLVAFEKRLRDNKLFEDYDGAVIIQEMIYPEVAGTCFTIDPVSKNPAVMIIEASVKSSDAVTSGRMVDFRAVISKDNLEIIDLNVQGSHQISLLSTLLNMCQYFLYIEKHFGIPQDIEWVIKNKQLFFLQTRPVTNIGPLTNTRDNEIWF